MNDMRVGVTRWAGMQRPDVDHEHNAEINVEWVEIDGHRLPGAVIKVYLGTIGEEERSITRAPDGTEIETVVRNGHGGIGQGFHTATVTFVIGSFATVDSNEA